MGSIGGICDQDFGNKTQILKRLILFFTSLLFILTISNGQVKYSKSDTAKKYKQNCIVHLDTSVNGVIFSDEKSFIKKFGDKHTLIDAYDCLYFANYNETEFMKLHHENGGGRNSYDEFEVSKQNYVKAHIIKTNEKHFISSNGIYIGMPLNVFFKKYKKSCFELSKKGNTLIYQYYYPYQTYYSAYIFSGNVLVGYSFGYDNS